MGNKIGRTIKALRKEQGMNAETLADKIGVSKANEYKYENGTIKDIKTEIMLRICKVLNVSPNELLGWDK